MKLAVIIVNYNGAKELTRLLKSLKNQTDSDFSITIVDNASDEVDFAILQKFISTQFSTVQVIRNTQNLGFAKANNIGLRDAFLKGSNWAFLLNPDTWVETAFIARLKAILEPQEGLLGIAIDEGSQIAYGGAVKWLKSTLPHILDPDQLTTAGAYIIGAALAISQPAYEKIGGLDENYFLYFEDADYSLKAQQAGVQITLTDDIKVHHSVSSITGKMGSPFLFRHHYRSALYFNYKNGPWYIRLVVWPWSGIILIKQYIKIILHQNIQVSEAIIEGVRDFYTTRYSLGASHSVIKIGIECESIEGKNPMWGVGRIIMKLLEEISRRPDLEKEFKFILYFKDTIPDFLFLQAPIFEKKLTPVPFAKGRLFPIYYYALLPIKLWFERLHAMYWPNYMLPIIAFGKSFVMLTEDVYHETHNGKLPFRYRLAYGIFGWWSAKFATRIMAISETSRQNVAQLYHIDTNRIVVNHLGVDLAHNNLPIANSKKDNYILYVGQAFERRHLRETILAFEKTASEFPDLKLIAIGPDKYETPVIKSLVAEVNNHLGREAVMHHDYVSDDELIGFYGNAKALIYVSDREAFGLPPMEALSYGVPPIVMDNPLGRELFGKNAFYVPEATPQEIAIAIRKALTEHDTIKEIKSSGPQAVQRFTWSKFTDRWLEMIRH